MTSSLLQNLHDEDMQDQLRNMLKPFYGVLKTMDGAIRFAFADWGDEVWKGKRV